MHFWGNRVIACNTQTCLAPLSCCSAIVHLLLPQLHSHGQKRTVTCKFCLKHLIVRLKHNLRPKNQNTALRKTEFFIKLCCTLTTILQITPEIKNHFAKSLQQTERYLCHPEHPVFLHHLLIPILSQSLKETSLPCHSVFHSTILLLPV